MVLSIGACMLRYAIGNLMGEIERRLTLVECYYILVLFFECFRSSTG